MNDDIRKKTAIGDVAIALGIICIVLVASVAFLINENDNTVQTNNSLISSLQSQVLDLSNIIDLFYTEVLFNQTISVQARTITGIEVKYNENFSNFNTSVNCSGYVSVTMEGFNLTSTWFEAGWWHRVAGGGSSSSDFFGYDQTRNFTASSFNPFGAAIDTEYFPILQDAFSAYFMIGNNGNQTVTEMLTIIFYY